jgi:hypothetical protein
MGETQTVSCPKCLDTGILRERFETPPRIRRCNCPQSLEKEKRAEESIERILIARAAIVEHTDGKRGQGKLPCPVYKSGDLGYTVASNGHIWGYCSSAGCVQWME